MIDDYADSYRNFLTYAAKLEMTILHDEGLYRHLQFGTRGACGWFELVTWPGNLAINGDIGNYVFARLDDMFEFFSGSSEGSINPGYWDEKIRAGRKTMVFSDEEFRRQVVEYFWERRDDYDGERRELFKAIREDVLECSYCIEDAHANLERFEYVPVSGRKTFQFRDTWEWNLRDWDIHYLRACHAIVWGISRYRALAVTR
ncbi:hypothetical protein [Nocardia abscessus]|uniref:hypothetical protein n=1 Tax=Nocardia abscessus TaxID=120957 RepID=UPI0002F7DCC5|nr:hypothetical protein [Nocardia abscessus]MCC3333527.1 hypothetical protein [Nocardia abscessus]